MGCIAAVARFILILITLMFVIIGFVLVAVGAMVKFVPDNPLLSDYEDQVKSELKTLLTSAGKSTSAIDSFSISDITGSLAFALMGVGGVILIFFFFGFVGAVCRLRKVLLIFSIVIAVFTLLLLCLIIIVAADTGVIKDSLKEPLQTSLQTDYEGMEGTSPLTIGWNFIMTKFHCCGVIDYLDFRSATKWQKTVISGSTTYTLQMPVACCASVPDDGNLTCAKSVGGNAYKGCLDLVWDGTLGDKTLITKYYLPVIAFFVFLIICSVLIFKTSDKQNAVADEGIEIQKKREELEREKKMKRFTVIEPEIDRPKQNW